MNRFLLLTFVSLTLAAAMAAPIFGAGCEEIPGNQVLDCSFEDGGPSGDWTVSWGTDFQREPPASGGAVSAHVTPQSGPISVWGIAINSACFPVASGSTYQFGANIRRSVDVGDCNTRILSYPEQDCSGEVSITRSPTQTPSAGQWITVEGMATPSGLGAQLEIYCTTGSPVDAPFLVDEAFAAPFQPASGIPTASDMGLIALIACLMGYGLYRLS